MSLVERFFNDIGGSHLYNIITQYPGTASMASAPELELRPSNSLTFGGSYIETRAFPSFFVFTPAGVTTCVEHGGCSGYEFAAYHGAYVLTGNGGPVYPNGELLDQMLSTTGTSCSRR